MELSAGTISAASATTEVQLSTNLDATAAVGTTYSTPITTYDSLGAALRLSIRLHRTPST